MLLLVLLLEISWFRVWMTVGDLAVFQTISSLKLDGESPVWRSPENSFAIILPKLPDVAGRDEPSSNNNDEQTGSEFARSRDSEVGTS
jgi:hypothetical protein